jgi:cell cycle checkpoint protein
MDSTLVHQWDAPGTPFLPFIGKGTQFLVGFTLVLLGLALTGGFTLSMS